MFVYVYMRVCVCVLCVYVSVVGVYVCVCVCMCVWCARVGLKVNRNPRLDARMQTQLTGPKTSWVIINTINNLFFSHRRHCQLLANFISTANNPLLLLRTAWSNFF